MGLLSHKAIFVSYQISLLFHTILLMYDHSILFQLLLCQSNLLELFWKLLLYHSNCKILPPFDYSNITTKKLLVAFLLKKF